MAKYKLTYFPVRAKAEPIRILFALAGVEFEDIRVDPTEWVTKLKPCEYCKDSVTTFCVDLSMQ